MKFYKGDKVVVSKDTEDGKFGIDSHQFWKQPYQIIHGSFDYECYSLECGYVVKEGMCRPYIEGIFENE